MLKALFSVGRHDALPDDSLFMDARWLAAGNEPDIEFLPDVVHGLSNFPTSLGRKAAARENAFLMAALDS